MTILSSTHSTEAPDPLKETRQDVDRSPDGKRTEKTLRVSRRGIVNVVRRLKCSSSSLEELGLARRDLSATL